MKRLLIVLSLLITNEGIANTEDEENLLSRTALEYQKADQLIGWIDSRSKQTLNGTWHYIVDPMDNGLPESIFGGFPKNKIQKDGMELIEYNFEKAKQLQVPGLGILKMKSFFSIEDQYGFTKNFLLLLKVTL